MSSHSSNTIAKCLNQEVSGPISHPKSTKLTTYLHMLGLFLVSNISVPLLSKQHLQRPPLLLAPLEKISKEGYKKFTIC